jgi:hypothetical protein
MGYYSYSVTGIQWKIRNSAETEGGEEVKVVAAKGLLVSPAWYIMVLADSIVNTLTTCLRTKLLKNMWPYS